MTNRRTIVLAGGGSGGHISPGLAVAERLADVDPGAAAHFACSTRAVDRLMLEEAGASFTPVPAAPFSLRPAAALRFALRYRRSLAVAGDVLARTGATHVLALGGFVSVPVAVAARRLGVPVTLLNLDAPPGRANRLVARRATRVLSAVELPTCPGFASTVTGLPVRRRAIASGPATACRSRLGLEPGVPTLAVTGASQGATSINAVMRHLLRTATSLFDGWQAVHLAGEVAAEEVRAAYEAAGVRARVLDFLHDMGDFWGAADIAVSRSGANSVAEARANAVPAIYLPYPHHRDQHQRHNAAPMERAGLATIVDDLVEPERTAPALANAIRSLQDEERRTAMRRRLEADRPPDAAHLVARMLAGVHDGSARSLSMNGRRGLCP